MKSIAFYISLVFLFFACQKSEVSTPDTGTTPTTPGKTLVWYDEFNNDEDTYISGVDNAVDATKWFHQTKFPNGSSWYNGEIQHYTNRKVNAYVSDGTLKIVAKKENFTEQGQTKNYTSARLNSKFAFTYGTIEIRAKLPTGVGTWPAIWTLGKNINERGAYWQQEGYGSVTWPACGEIDIMEHWGSNQNYVQSAMHTPSSHGGTVNKGGRRISTVSSDFHVYKLEWTAQKMTFSVDDYVHYIYNPSAKNASTWPFNSDQYLLLNIAIEPSIASNFTSSAMEIDYIRIYQ
jgi:beta-glucanase (GH16 family)